MKIAIHNGSGWNQKWIKYCEAKNIYFIVVNCYDNNIIETLKEKKVTHLMWYFHHNFPADILMARNVLYAAEKMGLKTFPNFDTSWHFDDKVSQKYLLEAMEAKMVPTYVFYDQNMANAWLREEASFPLVAKLRRGAGSYNVILLKNLAEARRYTAKMFGIGIHPSPGYISDVKNKLKVAKNWKGIKKRLKKAPNYFKMVFNGKKGFPREKGYVYFQDFIKDNKSDIRVAIVGDYIWAFKRIVREGDFRASGSGVIEYDNLNLSINIIKDLHILSKKIKSQSIAFDIIFDKEEYLIVEISYGYSSEAIFDCHGYWNSNYEFVGKKLYPEIVIIENIINN